MMGRPIASGESVGTRYSVEMLPDMIDVDFIDTADNGEHTTFAGRLNTRTGEFKMLRNYDLKGRKLNGIRKAHRAYYGRKVLKKQELAMKIEIEQKKEYIKPEVTVLEYVHQCSLLADSCVDDSCGESEFND